MTEPKKKRGSWKPGQSGNPAGRPPGGGEIGKLRATIGERVPVTDGLLLRWPPDTEHSRKLQFRGTSSRLNFLGHP